VFGGIFVEIFETKIVSGLNAGKLGFFFRIIRLVFSIVFTLRAGINYKKCSGSKGLRLGIVYEE
jgi:hypothetical protein